MFVTILTALINVTKMSNKLVGINLYILDFEHNDYNDVFFDGKIFIFTNI